MMVEVPTICYECPYGQCHVKAYVENGVLVKIEGDKRAPGNQGKLCAKAHGAVLDLYSPYRVKRPLLRTNPKKGLDVDPKWVEISWDEALKLAGEKLKEVRERDPARFTMGSWDVNFCELGLNLPFQYAYEAEPHLFWGGTSTQCGHPQHAFARWYADGFLEREDQAYVEYLLVFGTGFGLEGAGHGVAPSTFRVMDMIERGVKIVVVDPRQSVVAAKAYLWLPIRPGTDLALMLALMHVMIHEIKVFDADFLKKHTNAPYLIGPDEYFVRDKASGKPLIWDPIDNKAKTHDDVSIKDFALTGEYSVNGKRCKPAFQMFADMLKEYTPEWASQITTIPPHMIRRVAKEFVEHAKIGSTIIVDGKVYPYRPACSILYAGVTGHRNGCNGVRAEILLNMLVGNVGVPGGYQAMPIQGVPSLLDSPAVDGCLGYVRVPWKWPPGPSLHEWFPLSLETGNVGVIAHNYVAEAPPIEAFLYHHTNLIVNQGGLDETLKFLNRAYVIGASVWLDDMSFFADLILPEDHAFERLQMCRWMMHTQCFPYVRGQAIRQPVVKRLGDTKTVDEILIELAERVGILYGEGGLIDWINRLYPSLYALLDQGEDLTRFWKPLDVNKKPTIEEIYDRICRAVSKQIIGEEKGLDYFKEYGFVVESSQKNRYKYPFRGYRLPFAMEYLKRVGDDLKNKLEEVGAEKYGFPVAEIPRFYSIFPRWIPDSEHQPDQERDLFMIDYKTSFSKFASEHSILLMNIQERDPYLLKAWINKATAMKKGINEGDWVIIESRYGKIKLKVHLSECVHPEVVAVGAPAGGGDYRISFWRRGVAQPSHLLNSFNFNSVDLLGSAAEACTRVRIYRAV
jgi:anaerobic selenocysteine-containing dehydrogenase